jgi:hypothetical protein
LEPPPRPALTRCDRQTTSALPPSIARVTRTRDP